MDLRHRPILCHCVRGAAVIDTPRTSAVIDLAENGASWEATAVQIAQLSAQLERELSCFSEENNRILTELARVTAERDEHKRDAERYRWLRSNPNMHIEFGSRLYAFLIPEKLDAAIDAAIDAAMLEGENMSYIRDKIPGLAKPWRWIQPRTDAELIERLIQAREYNVHERERENLCSVAAERLQQLIATLEAQA